MQNASKLEVRLALVSSRLANCLIYASKAATSSSTAQQQTHTQQQQQQQALSDGSGDQQRRPQSREDLASSKQDVTVPEGVILTGCADGSVVNSVCNGLHSQNEAAGADEDVDGSNGMKQVNRAEAATMMNGLNAAEQQQHQQVETAAAGAHAMQEVGVWINATYSPEGSCFIMICPLNYDQIYATKYTPLCTVQAHLAPRCQPVCCCCHSCATSGTDHMRWNRSDAVYVQVSAHC